MPFEARRLRVELPNGNTFAFVGPGATETEAAEHAAHFNPGDKVIQAQCFDTGEGVPSMYWASCMDLTQYLLLKPGSLLGVNPVDLPVLRERLEAQLREIDDAQRASPGTGPAK